jgi:hypothetical protein
VALGLAFTGPGAWAVDELMPVELLYQPLVIWIVIAVALAVGLVAIMMRPPSPQSRG